MRGIDISHWQNDKGVIDFAKVKKAGYSFVIIKAGGYEKTKYIDPCFYDNYNKARLAGLHVGAYYFVGKNFVNKNFAQECAEHFHSIIKGLKFDMPVALDIETTSFFKKRQATESCILFCEYMENNGYYISIYSADLGGFRDRLYRDMLTAYDKWVARYGKAPTYVTAWGMWQKSSKGRVDGIKGDVDIDIASLNYPKLITSKHFNNY